MQRIVLVLAYFFICVNCFSQQYPFVHYTPREGLVNNRARFIVQDSKGKLYIATYGGFSVYDGARFINYNTNNGLVLDLINDIAEMGEDSIWIMPNANSIHCLVKGRLKNLTTTDNFIPLVNQLIKSRNGYYYAIADEGLFRLENKRFVNIPLTGVPKEEAKTLLQAAEIGDRLYIISNPDYKSVAGNLLVYDLSRKKVVDYDKNIKIFYLFKLSEDELLFSTQQGMYMLDNITGHHTPLTLAPLPDSFHIPKNLFPNFMYKDRQNNIWLTCEKGVYKIRKDGAITEFTTENGLTTNFQTSVFQDYENNMWFTNEQTGLCKLSNQQLAYYPTFSAGFTPTDIFIPTSRDSVFLYDAYHNKVLLQLPNGQTKGYENKEAGPGYAKFVSANGNYLLSGNKIFRMNVNQENNQYSISIYYYDSTNRSGFTDGIREKNGNLVAISNKVILFEGNRLISDTINYMADQVTIDNKNRVWTATRSNQLYCFEISGSAGKRKLSLVKEFSNIVRGSPRSVVADTSGNIWIGTRTEGLYCLHFNGFTVQSIRQLTTRNGISENFVNYLFCDKDNNIWACTPSGLDKIRIDNNRFLVENITRSANLYLSILKIQQTAKGQLWILTTSGVVIYNPVRIPVNGWKPRISFSDIIMSDTGQITLPDDRELKYSQNNLTFQLSTPTFIDEKQTRFSYLLEGSGNKNWSSLSTDASINFVNLPPGEYTLRAKAVFLHGLYPDTESTYSFIILPPWWETWWFKLLTGLLTTGLFILGLKFYIDKQLEIQRAMLEKKRAVEHERTRIATDMHDDLGAGLSQIKFLSETIGMKKQRHLPIEEEIDSIRSFSIEMIDKMGEIVWALNEKNDTLSDLLSYTRSYAVEYLEQNGIKCLVEEPDNISQGYVSSEFRRNIYLTVKESLHNIVKHAQATEVLIEIEITDWLSIKISDNGIGINNAGSSGNGLISMDNRVKELKGYFEIVSNNGTMVKIEVPLEQ